MEGLNSAVNGNLGALPPGVSDDAMITEPGAPPGNTENKAPTFDPASYHAVSTAQESVAQENPGTVAQQQAAPVDGKAEHGEEKEEEEAETDSDLDEAPPPEVAMAAAAAAVSAAPAPHPAPHRPAGGRRGGGRGGIISLKLLIDEGLLEPGEDVFTVEYKGMSHLATLLDDGRIFTVVNGKELTFESPSAFSIYLKRLINPTRKADDGWKTVKYRGRLLEHYKHELARQRLGGLSGEGGASTASLEAALEPRTKRPRTDLAPFTGLGGRASTGAIPAGPERPRRVRRAPPRFAAIGVDDEHALQPLEAFAPGEAPFTLRVSPAAEVMMDFHAHLCMNEVIGVLAGTWDPAARRIDVLRALPVRELATEDDSINVEMDPEDQVARMEEVSKAGMRVVGWYHSHPTFPAIPSTIDVYNQVLQQHAHREEGEGTHVEPYVAAIVSPYDHRTPSSASTINWFCVAHAPGAVPTEGQRPDEVGCVAKQLPAEQLGVQLGPLDNLPAMQREMERLAKQYAPLPDRANLEGAWYDGRPRIEKLVASVQSRLPVAVLGEGKVKSFASKLWVSTLAVWNIYGKPATAILGQGGSVMTNSVPGSAAVSQGGGEDGHDVDEPISDEEDTM